MIVGNDMVLTRMTKAVVCAGLSLSLVISSTPAVAFAETAQDRLDAATAARQASSAKLEDARSYLSSLSSQLEEKFSELELCQVELESTRQSISDTESQIEVKTAELGEARAELSESMSSNYKSGYDPLSFIMGASSFEELISRVYYADKVAASQSQIISNVETIQADLNAQNEALKEEQAAQEEQSQQLQAAAQDMQALVAEQQTYVENLSAEVQAQLAEEQAAKDAVAEEQARKEAEERAAREAEERAAQEAAAAAAAQQAAAEGNATTTTTTNDDGSTTTTITTDDGTTTTTTTNTDGSTSTTTSTSGTTQRSVDYGQGVSAAIEYAKSQVGVSYSWGGNAIEGVEFDCSGLVWWAFNKAGISIPRGQRMANGIDNSMIGWCLTNGGWTTSQANLQAGDLMFWGSSTESTGHVGLCIGGGMMVHSSWGGVEITSVYYSSDSFVGGGPIV